jgi:tryptophan-rich sensory protein
MVSKKWRWYHGVAFYGLVQAGSFGLGKLAQRARNQSKPRIAESLTGNADNNAFYNDLRQPVFAPPDWVFAPVWTLNNTLCIWGLLHVLNLPKDKPGRTAFLASQGTVWACFGAFNALYFGLRSPVNGAVNTNIGLAATLYSVYVALFHLKDRKAALSQATITPWLVLASTTATTVALWNKDDFYKLRPVIKPDEALVKISAK